MRIIRAGGKELMAGRLPGVGLPPRKRSSENYDRHEHHIATTYRRESLDLEAPWSSVTSLDETALKARQRLHKKLGYFFSSYRPSDNLKREGKGRLEKKGGKLLGSSWLLRVYKFRKERKVCAVCLEDLQQDKKKDVMNLSCSHKYHSACLLPWLAAHRHCPYCRTLIV